MSESEKPWPLKTTRVGNAVDVEVEGVKVQREPTRYRCNNKACGVESESLGALSFQRCGTCGKGHMRKVKP